MVATHSLHQPRFPLLSKESLVVIKTKVVIVSLKFFVSSHTMIVVVLIMVISDQKVAIKVISPRPVGQT